MKLLHFAHRPEAKAFLENSDFALINEAKLDLFYSQNLNCALLISGEGHLKALETCLQSISFFNYHWKKPITEIWNLGICGALNQKLQKNEIVQPHFSLFINALQSPVFQTYETHNEANALTCLTSENRIQSNDIAEQLKVYGDIVDRELWGVLRAASLSHLPVHSVKIVSDNARAVQCELIRDEAYAFSSLLKNWYDQNIQLENSAHNILAIENFLQKANIYQHPLLHFSQAQKHQIKKLYHGLKIQDEKQEADFLTSPKILEILQQEWTPKKKATEIISLMQAMLNPFMASWHHDLQKLTKPLRQENIQFHIDPKLESTQTTFSFECKDQSDLKNKVKALTDFSYHDFEQLMLGLELSSSK